MLKNYFKIALRNIKRHKSTSVINIIGLAFGICACLIIFLITQFELGYDTFHPDKEKIFRISGSMTNLKGEKFSSGCVPNPTADMLRRQIPEFETVAGFFIYQSKVTIANNNKPLKEFAAPKSELDNKIIVAQPEYFDIFKYQWLAGNPGNALNEPFKVVLSETEAQRYFGKESPENYLGKQVIYNDSLNFIVSGIIKDWKENSDFDFKDFLSWATIQSSHFLQGKINVTKWSNWDSDNQVFVKVKKNINQAQLVNQLAIFSKENLKPSDWKPQAELQPLKDIHFNASIGDDYTRKVSLPILYGLIAIAIFILLIAAINFINLSTAQSLQRSKEIGIRKVLGSSKSKLTLQFLSETFLLTFFATILAVLLINPLLQLFHSFIPPGLKFDITSSKILLFLFSIILITSFLAGFYPARVLSSYLPVFSLKGQNASNNNQKSLLRKSLIVFQFTISIMFIIGTLIIGSQIHYMLNKDMGFNKDAIINIKTDRKDSLSKRDVFVQRIKTLAGVSKVSASIMPPTAEMQNGTLMVYKGKQEVEVEIKNIMADENFIPLYDIKLLAGRNYSHSDTINQLLINESASKSLGFKNPEEAIGKIVFIGISDRPNSEQVFPITGVVKDFNAESLHDAVKPLFITPSSAMSRMVNVKLAFGKDIGQFKTTIASIEKIWKQLYPNKTFEYSFFDETIAKFYNKEEKTATIINTAMIVAIFISCMGLFGLVAFTTEQRTKEIGIRKVLGASVSGITVMLCKDFVVLVVVSLVIASPVAWYFMHRWLQDYPYRISISGWIFLIAGIAAVIIAIATVSIQSIKAAIANPVKSLRSE